MDIEDFPIDEVLIYIYIGAEGYRREMEMKIEIEE